jgi:hypothetical protein
MGLANGKETGMHSIWFIFIGNPPYIQIGVKMTVDQPILSGFLISKNSKDFANNVSCIMYPFICQQQYSHLAVQE